MQRRALGFFLAAVIVAAVAFTSRWWLPALPAFLGLVEANSDLIGVIESLVNIAYILGIVLFSLLIVFGFRSLREPVLEREPALSVNVSEGGRSAAVSGNVNQGAVVAGDNATVSVNISGDVHYTYPDVAASPVG